MSDKGSRRFSSVVVDGVTRTPSRAMLRAVGFTDADFGRPQVGIASTWSQVTPCNVHIDKLADAAAAGADAAGGKSVVFNTITVSDGISMGTPGMRYSLVSREVIADSIETVVAAEGFDGLVAIGGCDKNMPGCVMAMIRLNRPSVFVYGGTISRSSRPSAATHGAPSRTASSWRSSAPRSPDRGPAAACTRPTRWRRPSRPWD
jgi:dihydroxy-acid dehydratase